MVPTIRKLGKIEPFSSDNFETHSRIVQDAVKVLQTRRFSDDSRADR
jgi:hypothetical protein